MAQIILDEKTRLWRIVDGRSGKIVKTPSNHAVDEGGQRSQLAAFALLRAWKKRKRHSV